MWARDENDAVQPGAGQLGLDVLQRPALVGEPVPADGEASAPIRCRSATSAATAAALSGCWMCRLVITAPSCRRAGLPSTARRGRRACCGRTVAFRISSSAGVTVAWPAAPRQRRRPARPRTCCSSRRGRAGRASGCARAVHRGSGGSRPSCRPERRRAGPRRWRRARRRAAGPLRKRRRSCRRAEETAA